MGRRAPREATVDDYESDGEAGSSDPADELSRGWKVAMYAAALIPYGAWFVVLGSSILYYAWRKESPNKAQAINRHGWFAWMLGLAFWGAVWFLGRDASPAGSALPVVTEPVAERQQRVMGDIYEKVARDAVEQYGIAKRQGDPMQVCVQAGMVSAAWLQAKDEAEYTRWKAVEKADCAAAGVPR